MTLTLYLHYCLNCLALQYNILFSYMFVSLTWNNSKLGTKKGDAKGGGGALVIQAAMQHASLEHPAFNTI